MPLKLRAEHLKAIASHAVSTYPDECCGILLGKMDGDRKTILEVWQTENAWTAETLLTAGDGEAGTTKKRRYAIAPVELLRAQKSARDRDLDVVGFYHSHPDHPAIPSECDRSCAWPQYSYIIVSVTQGQAEDFRSWLLDENARFQPEEIFDIE